MDIREKLVELLQNAKSAMKSENLSCDIARNMFVVDFMMANGVTVQEWVSVDDRLPEENGRYLTVNKMWDYKICVFDLWFDGGFWYIDEEDDLFNFEVTHWMPMPHPPKGE